MLAQACAGLIGAGAGLAGQAISDFATGSYFVPENYLAAAAGGATTGVAISMGVPPTVAAGMGGAVQEGSKSLMKGDAPTVVLAKAGGGAVAAAGTAKLAPFMSASGKGPVSDVIKKIPGATSVGNNEKMTAMNLGKLAKNGTMGDISSKTAYKMMGGQATQSAAAATTVEQGRKVVCRAAGGNKQDCS